MLTQALAFAALALGAVAQSTTSTDNDGITSITATATSTSNGANVQTTVRGLVGTFTSGFAASVVSADPCSTTLAMQCTDYDDYACSLASGIAITVTQGPSAYEVIYSTATLGGEVTLSESCSLQGPVSSATALACTQSAMVSIDGTSTATKTTTTLTQSDDFNYAQIPITAGASKLPSAGASCTGSQHSGAKPTAVAEIYKVVVPIGAALMAGAAFV